MERDKLAFWQREAQEHMASAYRYGDNPAVRYPMYELRRDRVLELLPDQPGRILDTGCGAGHMIVEYLSRGWDAHGFDFSEPMIELAREMLAENNADPDRAVVGDMKTHLRSYEASSFDVVTALGLSQYLSEEDDAVIWAEIERVLKPDGIIIIDFVNALFDLTTFNRFSIRFAVDQIAAHFFEQSALPNVEDKISKLVTYPEKPDRAGQYSTRRDHVTKRTFNPLTINDEMGRFGLCLSDRLFYRFHAVPPLLFEQDPKLEAIAISKESTLARHWIGHFCASAFIAVIKKKEA